MSKLKMKFVDACLSGKASPDEIDDFVDRWHNGESSLSLPEFLGMSDSEYELWVKRADALHGIIKKRAPRQFGGNATTGGNFELKKR